MIPPLLDTTTQHHLHSLQTSLSPSYKDEKLASEHFHMATFTSPSQSQGLPPPLTSTTTTLSATGHQRLPSLRSILSTPPLHDPDHYSHYHARPLALDPRPASSYAGPTPFDPHLFPTRLRTTLDLELRHYPHHDLRIALASAVPSTSSLPSLSLPRTSASASPPLSAPNAGDSNPLSAPAAPALPPAPASWHHSPPKSSHRRPRTIEDCTVASPSDLRPFGHSTDSSSPRPNTAPRYLGLRHVPGQGPCHYYDDGTFCKTIIAGEPVNPAWGVTKAGKPRKRLAQACLTCREKKIKCEPDFPSCVQCTKQGRVCKKSSEQRENTDSSDADPRCSTRTRDAVCGPASGTREPPSAISSKRRSSYFDTPQSKNPLAILTGSTTAEPETPCKRLRRSTQTQTQSSPPSAQQWPISPTIRSPSMKLEMNQQTLAWSDGLSLSPDHDPYEVEPRLSMHLISLYFDYTDGGPHVVFPREQFIRWITVQKNKTRDEKVLLHAMLAYGSIFSNNVELAIVGDKLANIVRNAQDERLPPYTLQLAQTRLYLAMYSFARGHPQETSEYTATAMKALTALRYNTEDGLKVACHGVAGPFGLDPVQTIECRRRTFWLAYLLERYICFSNGYTGGFADADIYQYLPVSENDFRSSNNRATTLFEGGCLQTDASMKALNVEPGSMACLLPGVNILNNIIAHGFRLEHCSTDGYASRYHMYYVQTSAELAAWEENLPGRYRCSHSNTAAAIAKHDFNNYFVLQSIFCLSGMKLNNVGRCAMHSPEDIVHKIRRARRHARDLLSIASLVVRIGLARRSVDVENAMAQPMASCAILAACDILSAAGHANTLDDTIGLLRDARLVLGELGRFWHTAAGHARQVEARQAELAGFAGSPFWRVRGTLEVPGVRQDYDFVHGVAPALLFDALAGELDR